MKKGLWFFKNWKQINFNKIKNLLNNIEYRSISNSNFIVASIIYSKIINKNNILYYKKNNNKIMKIAEKLEAINNKKYLNKYDKKFNI